jgi:hypothetical protein
VELLTVIVYINIVTQIVEHKKATTYDVGDPGPGLEEVQKYGGVSKI